MEHTLNLTHLAAFHAVAIEGSVSRGAERLLVSQPAVSKQVRELEKAVGAQLLERLPRGVRLTEAGTLLAGYATRLFAIAAEARRAMDELHALDRGRISVAASPTLGVYLLPELFVRFRRRYPKVAMHLEIGAASAIAQRLVEGAVDLGLTEADIEGDAVQGAVLFNDELVAIAGPRHALAGKRLTAATLCREPFVVRETGSASGSFVERALADRGLAVKPVMSLGSTEAIKHAVAAGVGVAIVSSLAVQGERRLKRLELLRTSDLNLRRPVRLWRRSGGSDGVASAAFVEMLRECVKKLSQRRGGAANRTRRR